MNCGLPIDDAARQLGVHRRTLTGWIDRGAPVVRQGRPGRGRPTLVDPDALREWRGQPAAPAAPGLALDELGEALAWALDQVFELSTRRDRQALARELCLTWLIFMGNLADRLDVPSIADGDFPPLVRRLIRTAEAAK